MAMSRPQPVSVLLVASTSAALHGGAAVLFAPALSFILLCLAGAPGRTTTVQTETGMVIAVLSPLISAAFGFTAGALMALAHNVFAHDQRRLSIEIGETHKVRAASLSHVA